MLQRLTQIIVTAAVLLLLAAAALPSPQEAKAEKKYKDRQEYDIISKVFSEQDAAKRLALIGEWKEKYEETDYFLERLQFEFASYQQLSKTAEAVVAARELLKHVPGDFQATFVLSTAAQTLAKTDAASLAESEKATQSLLDGLIEKQFDAKNKPQNVSDEQWAMARKQVQQSGHQTLGWISMQRKDNVEAEKHFKDTLAVNANSGQVSYWLGQVVLAQGDREKNELAFYSFARAAALPENQGGLNAEGRKQVGDYLKDQLYIPFTGSEEGLEELLTLARQSPLPPDDLVIKSKRQRAFEAEQKSRKENPLLWQYKDLKKALLASGGDAIWTDLNGKLTPKMQLYVVSSDSERPQQLRLTSEAGGSVEVVLNLENRLRAAIPPGRAVTFEGVASGLTKDPFRLTLSDGKVL